MAIKNNRLNLRSYSPFRFRSDLIRFLSLLNPRNPRINICSCFYQCKFVSIRGSFFLVAAMLLQVNPCPSVAKITPISPQAIHLNLQSLTNKIDRKMAIKNNRLNLRLCSPFRFRSDLIRVIKFRVERCEVYFDIFCHASERIF